MRAAIVGIGEWLPEAVRRNDAWPADFAIRAAGSTDRELAEVTAGCGGGPCDAIVARYVAAEGNDPFLGTTARRVADGAMSSSEAEALAGRAALADAGLAASDVDYVCSAALTPDMATQGNASRVAHLIGAAHAVGFTGDAACASVPVQLTLAAALIESGRARTVLLTQSHLATRAFPFAHPASPNVGDAATALVVGAHEHAGILSFYGATHGEFYDAVTWRRSKDEEDSPWFAAGGPTYLGSRNKAAARMLVQNTVRFGAETAAEAVRRAGLALSEIDVLATVQPRRWVPGAIAEALGVAAAKAPQTFDERAHLGACGVVVNLLSARARGLLPARRLSSANASGENGMGERVEARGRGGPTVCLYAQGMGFTRAAMIVRWVV